jgi:hypothetical protein
MEKPMSRSNVLLEARSRRLTAGSSTAHFKRRMAVKCCGLLLSVSLAIGLCSCADIISSARNGDIDAIESSLNGGVSIETKSANGSTPLIVAAYSRRPKTVEYLLKRGADINATDNNHCSALIHAAYYNSYDVAEILVQHNADQSIKDRYGNTAHDYATQYGYTRIATLLDAKPKEKPAAASPTAFKSAKAGKRFHLCIFPWNMAPSFRGTRNANTKRAFKALIETLSDEDQMILTHCYYKSDIPGAFQDHFKDTKSLEGVDPAQTWVSRGALSPLEPDKAFIIQKGKEIGADLGLLVRTEKQGHGNVGIFMYLVDINKGVINKGEDSVYYGATYQAMQNRLRHLLADFISANEDSR